MDVLGSPHNAAKSSEASGGPDPCRSHCPKGDRSAGADDNYYALLASWCEGEEVEPAEGITLEQPPRNGGEEVPAREAIDTPSAQKGGGKQGVHRA